MENNGDVSIQKAGTAESIVDFLTLENTVNAATMDGTGSAILFKQYAYDAVTPAAYDMGKISFEASDDWTVDTATTRDTMFKLALTHNGTLTDRVYVSTNGNFGIKTPSPSIDLHVTGKTISTDGYYIGTITANRLMSIASSGSGTVATYIGDESITTSSDRRIKKNIVDTSANALDTLDKVRVVDFEWDDPSDVTNGKNARGAWTGVIAQEVIDHIPYAVNAPRDPQTMEPLPDAKRLDNEGNEFDQLWLLNYGNIVPLLIKAVQELKSEIAQLKEGN
jgi:hypothetical protein